MLLLLSPLLVLLFLHNRLRHFLLLFQLFFHVLYCGKYILLQTYFLLFCLHIFLFQFLLPPFWLIPCDVLVQPLTWLLLCCLLFFGLILDIPLRLFLLSRLIRLSFVLFSFHLDFPALFLSSYFFLLLVYVILLYLLFFSFTGLLLINGNTIFPNLFKLCNIFFEYPLKENLQSTKLSKYLVYAC